MTRTPDPKPKARKTQEKKTTTRRKPASSSIDSGDISPDLSQSGIQQFEARESTQGAQAKLESVLLDLGRKSKKRKRHASEPKELERLATGLSAIVDGAAPDDLALLRRALWHHEKNQGGSASGGDDALASNWREGGYPYRNRLRRKVTGQTRPLFLT